MTVTWSVSFRKGLRYKENKVETSGALGLGAVEDTEIPPFIISPPLFLLFLLPQLGSSSVAQISLAPVTAPHTCGIQNLNKSLLRRVE